MLVINCDAVSGTRQPFSAHRSGRAAAHNRNLTHRRASMKKGRAWHGSRRWLKKDAHDSGNTAAMNHAASIAENIAAAAADPVRRRNASAPNLCTKETAIEKAASTAIRTCPLKKIITPASKASQRIKSSMTNIPNHSKRRDPPGGHNATSSASA